MINFACFANVFSNFLNFSLLVNVQEKLEEIIKNGLVSEEMADKIKANTTRVLEI